MTPDANNRAIAGRGPTRAPGTGKRALHRGLLLAPALTVVLVLFGGGLMNAFWVSLGQLPLLGDQPLTLGYYQQLLQNPAFWRSLGWSLYLALASTLTASILALGCAMLLRRGVGRAAFMLFQLPLTLPHLMAGVAMMLLLSQSGLLARLAFALGWIHSPNEFPALINDSLGLGIIAAYVWKETPFIALILLAALRGQTREQEEAARTLGASPRQCFWHVTLPRLMPALVVSGVFVFSFTFGAFEVPLLLGPTSPEALPVAAWHSYRSVDWAQRPLAMAMTLILALISSLLCLIYFRLTLHRRPV